jgi:hypothetical protein
MENIHQQEKLPITENQIKEFLWWSKKFYGKGKTVKVWPGETETTFTSYEHLGKMCINAKNVLMNTIRIYNPKGICIEVFHDNSNTLWRTLAEDWKLDQKKLEQDLKWFKDCFPPLKERISKRIHNIFADK